MNFAMYSDNFFGHYLVIIQDDVNIKMLQFLNWEKQEHFAILLQ